MYLNENLLIEKFALLIEEGQLLNEQAIAEKTMDIMMFLSTDPTLCDAIIRINKTLQSLLHEASEADSSPKQVAQALRKLKGRLQH